MNAQFENIVYNCPSCIKKRVQGPETLIQSPFPDRPWQKFGADLFEWKGVRYLLLVDHFSIAKLSGEIGGEVILHMKSILAQHGIPDQIKVHNFQLLTFPTFQDSMGVTQEPYPITRKMVPITR